MGSVHSLHRPLRSWLLGYDSMQNTLHLLSRNCCYGFSTPQLPPRLHAVLGHHLDAEGDPAHPQAERDVGHQEPRYANTAALIECLQLGAVAFCQNFPIQGCWMYVFGPSLFINVCPSVSGIVSSLAGNTNLDCKTVVLHLVEPVVAASPATEPMGNNWSLILIVECPLTASSLNKLLTSSIQWLKATSWFLSQCHLVSQSLPPLQCPPPCILITT